MRDVKKLENEKIWYYVRTGLITSILIQHIDVDRANKLLNIDHFEIEKLAQQGDAPETSAI